MMKESVSVLIAALFFSTAYSQLIAYILEGILVLSCHWLYRKTKNMGMTKISRIFYYTVYSFLWIHEFYHLLASKLCKCPAKVHIDVENCLAYTSRNSVRLMSYKDPDNWHIEFIHIPAYKSIIISLAPLILFLPLDVVFFLFAYYFLSLRKLELLLVFTAWVVILLPGRALSHIDVLNALSEVKSVLSGR